MKRHMHARLFTYPEGYNIGILLCITWGLQYVGLQQRCTSTLHMTRHRVIPSSIYSLSSAVRTALVCIFVPSRGDLVVAPQKSTLSLQQHECERFSTQSLNQHHYSPTIKIRVLVQDPVFSLSCVHNVDKSASNWG